MIPKAGIAPNCLHCKTIARYSIVSGKGRYTCPTCPDAYVGCHKGSTVPLGFPCDAKTRQARGVVRAIMDPIWRDAPEHMRGIRRRLYAYLSVALDLPLERSHVGMFDGETCGRALAAVRGLSATAVWNWYEENRAALEAGTPTSPQMREALTAKINPVYRNHVAVEQTMVRRPDPHM